MIIGKFLGFWESYHDEHPQFETYAGFPLVSLKESIPDLQKSLCEGFDIIRGDLCSNFVSTYEKIDGIENLHRCNELLIPSPTDKGYWESPWNFMEMLNSKSMENDTLYYMFMIDPCNNFHFLKMPVCGCEYVNSFMGTANKEYNRLLNMYIEGSKIGGFKAASGL